MRSGAVWVGVSAQQVGIDGGVGPGTAFALKNADPERYRELSHPGDAWSYDIFSQAGAAVWFDKAVLGRLEPKRLIAFGWSQSASRLTTYINAVAPLMHVYNAYLLRSRFGFAASLGAGGVGPAAARLRTDVDVPVFVLQTEGDVLNEGLGSVPARQPDTRRLRSWEVTGTAHGDTYSHGLSASDDGSIDTDRALFDTMLHPPAEVNDGAIKCARPINAGPAAYVLRAVMRHVNRWARDGTAPPKQPPIELAPGNHDAVRDDHGNAIGGVRTPHVDVPVATLSGIGNSAGCFLFGATTPFDAATLAIAYPDHAPFVAAWNKATTTAVRRGVILAEDAKRLRAAREGVLGRRLTSPSRYALRAETTATRTSATPPNRLRPNPLAATALQPWKEIKPDHRDCPVGTEHQRRPHEPVVPNRRSDSGREMCRSALLATAIQRTFRARVLSADRVREIGSPERGVYRSSTAGRGIRLRPRA